MSLSNLFYGVSFALDLDIKKINTKDRIDIQRSILKHGGLLSHVLDEKHVYVIVDNKERVKTSEICRKAANLNVPIVKQQYIHDCISAEYLLGYKPYSAIDDTSVDKKTDDLNGARLVDEISLSEPDSTSADETSTDEMDSSLSDRSKWVNQEIHSLEYTPYTTEDDSWVANDVDYDVVLYSVFKNAEKEYCYRIIEIHVCVIDGRPISEYRLYMERRAESATLPAKIKVCYMTSGDVATVAYLGRCHKELLSDSLKLRWNEIPSIGSQNFKKMNNWFLPQLDEKVSKLVSGLWNESVFAVTKGLSTNLASVKFEKICAAEGILHLLKSKLSGENSEEMGNEIDELMEKYQTCLPFSEPFSGDHRRYISYQMDFCQLLRDVLSVMEMTNYKDKSNIQAKYKALKCHISAVIKNSEEWSQVCNLINSSKGCTHVNVSDIYTVSRLGEKDSYNPRNLENIQKLFHASKPQNFVGILSRGLLLPKFVVEEHGVERSDAGLLGCGIYFARDADVSAKYTKCCSTTGLRYMVLCSVALGKCQDAVETNAALTNPVDGHDSMHAVGRSHVSSSQFEDDEYVIYNIYQQKIEYLIEFLLDSDIAQIPKQIPFQILEATEIQTPIDKLKIEKDLQNILSVKPPDAGLVSRANGVVPLREVHIRGKIKDLTAKVVIIQHYFNDSDVSIESKFVFPVDELAAVCGFEAFINGKHVVGEVKEKETAHKIYRKAIKEDHGAYLMDQDEETPGVFTVSVGNLPAQSSAIIKITYVTELRTDDKEICFKIPQSVAPWKRDQLLQEITQDVVQTVGMSNETAKPLTIELSIEMPQNILHVFSVTHEIREKVTDTKAVVTLADHNHTWKTGFELGIELEEMHSPRMSIEIHPDDPEDRVCVLTYYPQLHSVDDRDPINLFLMDFSNSMEGQSLKDGIGVLSLLVSSLDKDNFFNVITFGTGWDSLFPIMDDKNEENYNHFIKYMESPVLMGGSCLTQILKHLRVIQNWTTKFSRRINLFLISDGHLDEGDTVKMMVRDLHSFFCFFTISVSETSNQHLLRSIAKLGGGTFEFFNPIQKYRWQTKAKNLLNKSEQTRMSSVVVEWQTFDSQAVQQAPKFIDSIFNTTRLMVYGSVNNCNMATLKYKIGNEEKSIVAYSSEMTAKYDLIAHRLMAKALIEDVEDRMLDENRVFHEAAKLVARKDIINLSIKYSVLSKYTSFIAVEQRDPGEEIYGEISSDNILLKLLRDEDVDFLPTMDWSEFRCSTETTVFPALEHPYDGRIDMNEQEALPDTSDMETSDLFFNDIQQSHSKRHFTDTTVFPARAISFSLRSQKKMEQDQKSLNMKVSDEFSDDVQWSDTEASIRRRLKRLDYFMKDSDGDSQDESSGSDADYTGITFHFGTAKDDLESDGVDVLSSGTDDLVDQKSPRKTSDMEISEGFDENAQQSATQDSYKNLLPVSFGSTGEILSKTESIIDETCDSCSDEILSPDSAPIVSPPAYKRKILKHQKLKSKIGGMSSAPFSYPLMGKTAPQEDSSVNLRNEIAGLAPMTASITSGVDISTPIISRAPPLPRYRLPQPPSAPLTLLSQQRLIAEQPLRRGGQVQLEPAPQIEMRASPGAAILEQDKKLKSGYMIAERQIDHMPQKFEGLRIPKGKHIGPALKSRSAAPPPPPPPAAPPAAAPPPLPLPHLVTSPPLPVAQPLLKTAVLSRDILSESGIVIDVEKFTQGKQALNETILSELISLQLQDGSWLAESEVFSLLNIDEYNFLQTLTDAGINSLGINIAAKIWKLVMTGLALTVITAYLCPNLFPMIKGDNGNILKRWTTVFQSLHDTANWIKDAIEKGIAFYKTVDEEFPMIYHQLELGRSWFHAYYKFLGPKYFTV